MPDQPLPNLLGWVIPVMVCFTLIFAVPSVVERGGVRIPISRSMTYLEMASFEAQIGARVTVEETIDGDVVIVARLEEQRVRAELKRLGLLPESGME